VARAPYEESLKQMLLGERVKVKST
jgi:hypothetical protein